MANNVDPGSIQPNVLLSGASRTIAIVVCLLPATAALLIAILLIIKSDLQFASLADLRTLNSLALIALFCLAGLGVGYGIRLLLPPLCAPSQGTSDHNRDRLARYVVIVGSLGIFAIALAIVIAVAIKDTSDDWKETILSIFTSVLPVFSTWVGTVLAFYFTNETVRRTQQTQAQAPNGGSDPITRAGTMTPYQSIPRIELDPAAAAELGAVAAAEAIPLSEIQNQLGSSGPSRVIIFDHNKVPVFVVFRTAMPEIVASSDTLKTYLDTALNREASLKFAPIAATATIAEARNMLAAQGLTDLFVTANGRVAEPTMGWVSDESLGT